MEQRETSLTRMEEICVVSVECMPDLVFPEDCTGIGNVHSTDVLANLESWPEADSEQSRKITSSPDLETQLKTELDPSDSDEIEKDIESVEKVLQEKASCEQSNAKNKPKYVCTICNQDFLYQSVLAHHMLQHSKGYPCPICKKPFSRKTWLKRHTRDHSEEEIEALEDHEKIGFQQIKDKLDVFLCAVCNRSFKSLTRHKCELPVRKVKSLDNNTNDLREASDNGCSQAQSKLAKNNIKGLKRSDTKSRNSVLSSAGSKSSDNTFDGGTISDLVVKKCDICQEEFQTELLLVKHLRKHKDLLKLKCFHCNKFFSSRPELSVHNLKNKHYLCDVCGKAVTSDKALKLHRVSHIGVKLYECPLCKKMFTYRSTLKGHYWSHRNHTEYNPAILKEVFKAVLQKVTPVSPIKTNSHTDAEKVAAPVSLDKMNDHATSRKMKEVNLVHKIYHCDVCGKDFPRNYCLKLHARMHTGEKPYECDVCGVKYSSSSALRRHSVLHANDEPHVCKTCNKAFTIKWRLKQHEATHTERSRRFICEICGKGYLQECSLTKHQLTHSAPEFACELCGKMFNYSDSLRKHMLVHSGEQPYKCETCGKGFMHPNKLKSHNMDHTGEKPFKCEVCGRDFKDRQVLKDHKRTHTGERPYVCKFCGLSFAHSATLWRHKRIHKTISVEGILE